MGETFDENMVSNINIIVSNMSHDEPEAHNKMDAPTVPLNVSLVSEIVVKPKLSKITLPKSVTEFRGFWKHLVQQPIAFEFTYLHALLQGTAARSIQGLALTEAN